MSEVTIKLRDLGELVRYGDTIKIIDSGTGRVLVYSYNKEKHSFLGDLEISGIFSEIEVGGVVTKNWARSKIVGWASGIQYKELKERAKEGV